MNYKVGDVINYNWNDSIFFKLETLYNKIKYGESKATHSGIIYEVGKDYIVSAEALDGGFSLVKIEKWWLDWKIKDGYITVHRSKTKLTKVKECIDKYLGLPYDFVNVFLMAFRLSFNSTKHLFCSEAVARVLYDASNKQIVIREDWEKITPMDLYLTKFLMGVKQ